MPKRQISAVSAGVQFALCVLVPLLGGYAIDSRAGTGPWGILGGFIVGLVWAAVSVLRPLWTEAEDEPHQDRS